MRKIRNFENGPFYWVLLIISLCSLSFAQQDVSKNSLERAEQGVRLWHSRVADLIKTSLAASSSLTEPENSFHLALLAKQLWKHDESEARTHLKRSAEIVLSGLKTDDEKALEQNLIYAQKTLRIVFELDEKFGTEIVGKLAAGLEDSSNQSVRRNPRLAGLYASIGIQVAKVNPNLALAYGTHSLRYGFALELPALVVELNLKDASSAESLIKRARALAAGNYTESSYLLAFNLNRYIADSNKGKSFSPAVHRLVVELFLELLSGAASLEQERPRRCGIAYYAPWITPRIDEFFPEQSLRFRENIQLCVPFLPTSTRGRTTSRNDGMPDSVDDLLKAAREAKDNDLKIHFYRTALLKLMDAKNYEAMISILDGFDGDEYQEIAPIGWDNWRVRASSAASLASFEAGDLPSCFRFINSTPKRLRPLVRKQITANSKVVDDLEFYTENLNEMQKELDSIEIPYHEAARLYLDLARLYLSTTPTESQIMFRNAAKFINKTDNDNPDFLPEKDWAPMQDYVSVDAELLENDELSIFATLNDISSRRSRLRLSLGLLESSIKRLNEAKEHMETLKRSSKKAS